MKSLSNPKIELSPNNPTITNFERKDLGDGGDWTIFVTTVEELTFGNDNTPVLDAEIRALETALSSLKKLRGT